MPDRAALNAYVAEHRDAIEAVMREPYPADAAFVPFFRKEMKKMQKQPKPTFDPIADSIARNYDAFDPFAREAEIHATENVAIIGPKVENSIDRSTGTGILRLGGSR